LTISGTYSEPHGDHSHTHEIGRRNYPIPDQKSEFSNFDKQVEGMAKGEEKIFEIEVDNERLGKSLKGKHIEFNLKIEEIHTVQLPEVDDEFAKSLGEFEDLKALKEEIKNSLIELKKAEERRKAGDALLDKVIDKNEFEIPKAYIEDEVNNIINYKATQLLNMGINLRHNPIDWEKMRDDVRDDASKNVARMMTLINIADKEGIKVEEKEVEEKVKDIADQRKVSNTKLLADFKKSGEFDRIKTDILFTKTVDFLFEINHIKIG
jgi:trigger factor